MSVTCRLATPADLEALARLFHAVDLHYWGAEAPSAEAMAGHVRDRILAPRSGCETALAEVAGQAVGLATFAMVYPAPKLTGQLFLKDLFTVAEARGQGVGLELMRFLARLALERGCSRLDWTAERHNPRALDFYDRLGAQRVEQKVYYRIDGDALARLGKPED